MRQSGHSQGEAARAGTPAEPTNNLTRFTSKRLPDAMCAAVGHDFERGCSLAHLADLYAPGDHREILRLLSLAHGRYPLGSFGAPGSPAASPVADNQPAGPNRKDVATHSFRRPGR